MVKVVVHKESDLFSLFYDEDNVLYNFGIISHVDNLKCMFIRNKDNYSLTGEVTLGMDGWHLDFVDDINLYVYLDQKIFVYNIVEVNGIPSVSVLHSDTVFNYNNPITMFLGCEGGGTSIVVKLLRYLGIHFGDDCGEKTIRKPHESISMVVPLKMIDENTPTFLCRELFNRVWSVYGYDENKINCTKLPHISDKLIKLGEVFPNIKFVSVIKKQTDFVSTEEGKKFLNLSESDVLKSQRPLIEGSPIFNLNFDKFFTDFNYVNKLLRFLGSTNFLSSEKDLNLLKKEIGFDNKVLL